MNARFMTSELLRKWESGEHFADALLAELLGHLDETVASARERAMTIELFYGVVRNQTFLDWVVDSFAAKEPRRAARTLLRLGAYQVLFLDRVPAAGVVSEMTNLARRRCSEEEAQFVNAILRKVASDKGPLRESINRLKTEKPAIYYSHPEWLWQRWESRWGRTPTEELCGWNNSTPSVVVRVNQLKTDPEIFVALLTVREVVFLRHPKSPLCFTVDRTPPELLPGFKEGFFYIQDPSTLLAVDFLDPQPGESVLDTCAAPGGKTMYAAEKMQNRGRIVACDAAARRLKLVAKNAERLGVTIVESVQADFESKKKILHAVENGELPIALKSFDRVLVDAPCSNTGVMRRRVDVRWRLKPNEFAALAKRQVRLLESAAQFVKEGGVLVYSTCSLEQEENEGVVDTFLKSHPQFRLEEARSTFPTRDEMDGAFAAKLVSV